MWTEPSCPLFIKINYSVVWMYIQLYECTSTLWIDDWLIHRIFENHCCQRTLKIQHCCSSVIFLRLLKTEIAIRIVNPTASAIKFSDNTFLWTPKYKSIHTSVGTNNQQSQHLLRFSWVLEDHMTEPRKKSGGYQ